MTPYGYVGAGTFESPYKTMGKFDTNMDTAIALNAHGGTSQGKVVNLEMLKVRLHTCNDGDLC